MLAFYGKHCGPLNVWAALHKKNNGPSDAYFFYIGWKLNGSTPVNIWTKKKTPVN